MSKSDDATKGIATLLFLGVFALLTFCVHRSSTENSAPSRSTTAHGELDEAAAFTISKMYVQRQLKSPSTAKFCSVTDGSVDQVGDKVKTYGWVDSQNSFGATMRTHWACELHRTAEGDYVVDEFAFKD